MPVSREHTREALTSRLRVPTCTVKAAALTPPWSRGSRRHMPGVRARRGSSPRWHHAHSGSTGVHCGVLSLLWLMWGTQDGASCLMRTMPPAVLPS